LKGRRPAAGKTGFSARGTPAASPNFANIGTPNPFSSLCRLKLAFLRATPRFHPLDNPLVQVADTAHRPFAQN
jgi:hypothetical protein